MLAQIVSIIDRDCNLDLLLDTNCNESLKKLWLDIFGDIQLLNVPYTRLENKYVIIDFKMNSVSIWAQKTLMLL